MGPRTATVLDSWHYVGKMYIRTPKQYNDTTHWAMFFAGLDATATAATAATSTSTPTIAATAACSRVLLASLGLGRIINEQCVERERVRQHEVSDIVPADRERVEGERVSVAGLYR
jgi:hypothetical protein